MQMPQMVLHVHVVQHHAQQVMLEAVQAASLCLFDEHLVVEAAAGRSPAFWDLGWCRGAAWQILRRILPASSLDKRMFVDAALPGAVKTFGKLHLLSHDKTGLSGSDLVRSITGREPPPRPPTGGGNGQVGKPLPSSASSDPSM